VRSPKHLLIWLLLIAAAAALAEFMYFFRTPPTEPPRPTGGLIAGRARVVDGDSLIVGTSRIRLYGIDAPEGRQHCRDAQGRSYPCGEAARRALLDTIAGREVSCTPVGASHDRSVAVCIVDGSDLSDAMVRSGHALELRQHSKGRYAAAEREARDARRGLWAGDFERPAEWRRREGGR
jgi:endonuclease YncB( thermonuclease family)